MDIIGQDNLIALINKQTLDSFPHSLLLEGEKGAGKHLLCNYIQTHLALELLDITDQLNFETINECYIRTQPYIYVIDTTKMSIKQQNVILKFLEEPLTNAYIILLCTNRYNLLPTIINRCIVWKLQPYSKDVLQQFIPEQNNEQLLALARTPGQVKALMSINIQEEVAYIDKIFNMIGKATFTNMLKLLNHIAFENEQDKIDVDIFIDLLLYVLALKLKDNCDYYYAIKDINTLMQVRYTPNIDKKHLLENFFIKLWGKAKRR